VKSVYVMSDRYFFRLMRRYHEVVYRGCGEAIKVGDKVLSINDSSACKLYHFDCWNGLFINI